MGAPLALLICSIGVLGLFFLNRDKSVRTSKALWLPVIWLWVVGSRPVSSWFGVGGGGSLASTLDGSPVDAAIFEALIVAGLLVLFQRSHRTNRFLKLNAPILAYFLYCMISTAWSPIHEPAFKRWIKAIGDLVMVLLVVTDTQPIAALQRLYSRVGFILLPFSVALIRYTDLGRGYDPDGNPMNTGVTTNKNSLGLVVFVVSLGALWSVRTLILDRKAPNRTRRLVAQGTLLAFGIALLQMAHSATCVFCFALGAGLMFATDLRAISRRPARVHALCLGALFAGVLIMLTGGTSMVTGALGRDSTLSGRTDIWRASLNAADSPILGTGFESFWNVNIGKVAAGLPGYWGIQNLVSAHNGYLQIYLDLGWVGLCLVALIIISGYRRASRAFYRDRGVGSLMLVYIITAAFYNITEAGFRVLCPDWIFLLLAVISAGGVAAGLIGGEKVKIPASSTGQRCPSDPIYQLLPETETAFANWPVLGKSVSEQS
jgi:exopolysaccharide production protein ExoQ